ncbi:ketopantoate reductase family protein [Roseomonas xinghualingensis]|uniref:ketopantoate reductase family protein n=1 Tax=Roseomonas xinghualingensis TaxID=2986475 RepID=UPI0021F0F6AE|nr:2-dehydropantoate 2-reductase [Roseomonas sp. SXEYE001]MCV4210268.1 2-dehydropantoate 2-reductase [Roseomonas sp. SXEYE001]
MTRIAIVGAGAVGGYVAAPMAVSGHDVVLIDSWRENVDSINEKGLTIRHLRDVPEFTAQVRAVHDSECAALQSEDPFDLAFICVKSYHTAAKTQMIAPLLAPSGFAVSLQNGINEEVIAGVLGRERVLGAIASQITVELKGPGHITRASGKAGAAHTVYRVGELDGGVMPRTELVTALLALSDSAKITSDLSGERWTKLIVNVMANGIAAATGLISRDAVADDQIRAFASRLGSEAIRVAQALGYQIGTILHLDPEVIARAGEGDEGARRAYDTQRLADTQKAGGGAHLPSMGQDIAKGRQTEIDFINGFVVEKAKNLGIKTPANAALVEVVKAVESGRASPSPDLIRRIAA